MVAGSREPHHSGHQVPIVNRPDARGEIKSLPVRIATTVLDTAGLQSAVNASASTPSHPLLLIRNILTPFEQDNNTFSTDFFLENVRNLSL